MIPIREQPCRIPIALKQDAAYEGGVARISKGIRGRCYQRLLKEGTNVVGLDPDVAEVFRDSAAVNDVLRSFLRVARSTRRPSTRLYRTARKRTAA